MSIGYQMHRKENHRQRGSLSTREMSAAMINPIQMKKKKMHPLKSKSVIGHRPSKNVDSFKLKWVTSCHRDCID